jgi:hypothetical protein
MANNFLNQVVHILKAYINKLLPGYAETTQNFPHDARMRPTLYNDA